MPESDAVIGLEVDPFEALQSACGSSRCGPQYPLALGYWVDAK